MKKLENPRKYIERLKRRIANLEEWSHKSYDAYFREKGKHWLTLKEGAFTPVAILSPDKQSELRIGRKLHIEAEIAEYHASREEITVTMELKAVRVLDVEQER